MSDSGPINFDEILKELESITDARGTTPSGGRVWDLDSSFDLPAMPAPKAPPKPECECGARKTGTADYAPGHSTWCPVAEDEETQEI